MVLGGLCCKVLLGGSWRSSSAALPLPSKLNKPVDAAAAATTANEENRAADDAARVALSSKPMFSRHTPPFRAAAAAFAVALVSTQLL